MRYADWDALLRDLASHREAISQEFDRVAFPAEDDNKPLRQQFLRAWESGASEAQWQELLQREGGSECGRAGVPNRLVCDGAGDATDRLHCGEAS